MGLLGKGSWGGDSVRGRGTEGSFGEGKEEKEEEKKLKNEDEDCNECVQNYMGTMRL